MFDEIDWQDEIERLEYFEECHYSVAEQYARMLECATDYSLCENPN